MTIKTIVQNSDRDSIANRQFLERECLSVNCNAASVSLLAPVASLSQYVSPPTIARFLIAIIIDAVDRIFLGRSLAHISNKVFKLIPTVTNLNAATAVVSVILAIRIGATVSQPAPDFKFRRPTLSVSFKLDSHEFIIQTSTTSSMTGPKSIGSDGDRLSAITSTNPKPFDAIRIRECNHSKTTESLAHQVKCFHEDDNTEVVSRGQ